MICSARNTAPQADTATTIRLFFQSANANVTSKPAIPLMTEVPEYKIAGNVIAAKHAGGT